MRRRPLSIEPPSLGTFVCVLYKMMALQTPTRLWSLLSCLSRSFSLHLSSLVSRTSMPARKGAFWRPRSQDQSISRACHSVREQYEARQARTEKNGHCGSVFWPGSISIVVVVSPPPSPCMRAEDYYSLHKGGNKTAQICQHNYSRLQQSGLQCAL